MVKIRHFKLLVFILHGILIIVLSYFLFDIYLIPSDSMYCTIFDGDIVIVKSWSKQKIKNNDIIVFHFFNSDTVYKNKPEINFYESLGRKKRAFAFFDTSKFGALIYLDKTIKPLLGIVTL